MILPSPTPFQRPEGVSRHWLVFHVTSKQTPPKVSRDSQMEPQKGVKPTRTFEEFGVTED